MRILQLIDTLNPGGAERMAVNYANSVIDFGHESFLVTTREEGGFKTLLNKNVRYFFLDKKNTLDRKALSSFKNILEDNNIDIVHAHGTSWFFAVLNKLGRYKFKIVWHNHFGATAVMPFYKRKFISIFSRHFDGIISVNDELKDWAYKYLNCKKSIELENFVIIDKSPSSTGKNGFNVVCLANLRPVKNHSFLLEACDLLSKELPLNLHLIGKDYNDDYSNKLKEEFKKRSYVKYHGSLIDPFPVLDKMKIGVLSSNSEGMPMAILEYGAAGIPIVSTSVGASSILLTGHANILKPGDVIAMASAIREYLVDVEKAERDSKKFKSLVNKKYSSSAVIPFYLAFCKSL